MWKLYRKKIIYIFIIVILVVLFIFLNIYITEKNRCQFMMCSDDNTVVYQIEKATLNNDELIISGWFIELKSVRNMVIDKIDNTQIGVLLYDVSNENKNSNADTAKPYEGINLDVELIERPDIDEYFKCEYNYSYCGFKAKASLKNLDIDNKEYRICIKPNNDEMNAIACSAFINKGKLEYIYSKDKINANTDNEALNHIFTEGTCLAGCPEVHIWVYQLDWKLYWIIDHDYDDDTNFYYIIDTTQYNKLPEEIKNQGWNCANLSDHFEEYEITNEICSNDFRVFARDIPINYSITAIFTGNADWQCFLRPIYNVN